MAACRLTVPSFLLCTYILVTQAQQSGFPEVFDVSRDQQVLSVPASAVCGLPTVSAFCRSTTSVTSVSRCLLSSCTGECPRRMATPAHLDLLFSVRSSTCVVRDYVNVRPGSSPLAYSVRFLHSVAKTDSATCYVRPPVTPRLSSDGSFTVTFWVWLDTNSTGFVFHD